MVTAVLTAPTPAALSHPWTSQIPGIWPISVDTKTPLRDQDSKSQAGRALQEPAEILDCLPHSLSLWERQTDAYLCPVIVPTSREPFPKGTRDRKGWDVTPLRPWKCTLTFRSTCGAYLACPNPAQGYSTSLPGISGLLLTCLRSAPFPFSLQDPWGETKDNIV